MISAANLKLRLQFAPSSKNLADGPSRMMSDLDVSLSEDAWRRVDRAFGPHSADLMALPFNVMRDGSGRPLRYFSPVACKDAAGTNVFAQKISPDENAYVFPPFVLIGPLVRFLLNQGCSFTMVAPDLYPRQFWWPILVRSAYASFMLGAKGDSSVLRFPKKSSPDVWESRPLQWNLWVFRVASR